MNIFRIIPFLLALSLAQLAQAATPEIPLNQWATTDVSLNGRAYRLYIADSDQKLQQGLMHVSDLPLGHGVLFPFSKEDQHCMWMKNTLIPLKVIFIDAAGKYINDIDMEPGDLTPRCSLLPSKYAIEVNRDDM